MRTGGTVGLPAGRNKRTFGFSTDFFSPVVVHQLQIAVEEEEKGTTIHRLLASDPESRRRDLRSGSREKNFDIEIFR